jgi:hypothetical protein
MKPQEWEEWATKRRVEREQAPVRARGIQQDIMQRELQDPMATRYAEEYRGARGMQVGRPDELARAGAAEAETGRRQMAGAMMARRAAAGGPSVSPYLLQAQQNQLARQAAAMRAAGGPMAARGAMMAAGQRGGDVATSGVGQMAQEDLQGRMAALGATGAARAGTLMRAGLGIQQEQAEDAYRNALEAQAMKYLQMGQDEKEAYQNAMLNLLGATTQQYVAPTQPSMLPQIIGGVGSGLATMIPHMTQAARGGGGVIDPSQLQIPDWAK